VSSKKRYYSGDDVIALHKLVTFKDNGMTLIESVEGIVLWHNSNKSPETDIAPHQTDMHDITEQDSNALYRVT